MGKGISVPRPPRPLYLPLTGLIGKPPSRACRPPSGHGSMTSWPLQDLCYPRFGTRLIPSRDGGPLPVILTWCISVNAPGGIDRTHSASRLQASFEKYIVGLLMLSWIYLPGHHHKTRIGASQEEPLTNNFMPLPADQVIRLR